MNPTILLLIGACLCLGSFATFTLLSSIPTNFVPEEEVPWFYWIFFNFRYNPNQNAILYPTPTLLTNMIIGTCLIVGFGLIYKSVARLEKTKPPQEPKPHPLRYLTPYLQPLIILVTIVLMTGIFHSILYSNLAVNLVIGVTIFLGVFGLHSAYKSLNARNSRSRWLILFVSSVCIFMAYLTLNALL